MKKQLFTLIFVLFATISFAQSTFEAPQQNISTDSDVAFRLFSTQNMFTFIKLDKEMGECGKFSGVRKEVIIDMRQHYRTYLG